MAEIDRPQLLRQARALRREYDVIVIDCPAKFADSSSAAIRVADFVLVPVQPSPFDVWASDAVAGLIKTRQEATGGAPLAAAVKADVLREGTRQFDVALPVELHQRPKIAAVQDCRAGMSDDVILFCKCR